jgi:GTP-binding protein Era
MTEAKRSGAQRCGFVALIGAPNSGKSTLINALVRAKVAIVTQKAQTTRAPVLGIALEGQSQIILVDTPASFSPNAGSTAPCLEPPGPALRKPISWRW